MTVVCAAQAKVRLERQDMNWNVSVRRACKIWGYEVPRLHRREAAAQLTMLVGTGDTR